MSGLKEFKNQKITSGEEELQNPFIALSRWMDESKQNNLKNYNSVAFSTVDKDGHPDTRQMIIKQIDEKTGSLVFYTNEKSAKGKEIAENPHVAINGYWRELDRSFRIRGQAEFVTEKESDEYWKTRSLDAQVAATISEQGVELSSKEDFAKKFEEAKEKAEKEGKVDRPSFWHGYRIYASSIELWMEGSEESRVHCRMEWKRNISRKGNNISDVSGFDLGEWTHKYLQP